LSRQRPSGRPGKGEHKRRKALCDQFLIEVSIGSHIGHFAFKRAPVSDLTWLVTAKIKDGTSDVSNKSPLTMFWRQHRKDDSTQQTWRAHNIELQFTSSVTEMWLRRLFYGWGHPMENLQLSQSTPPVVVFQRSPCPLCKSRLVLSSIKFEPTGSACRTFKCNNCNHVERVVIAASGD
jgi:hypothetical protein